METIQELIAVYAETKSLEAYQAIIKKVQTVNKLWAAYSPVTKNHYMEYFNGKPAAFIFSQKEFCETFKEHLAIHQLKIESELCKSEDRIQFFSDLYRSGIENIVLDNGQQFIGLSLSDIIRQPDFSSLSKQEQPVMNPSLVVRANLFFQTFDAGTATKNTRKNVLRALYQGKYLMPVIADQNTPLDGLENVTLKAINTADGITVTVPALQLEENQILIPFFTDWVEFSRFDRDRQCIGNIVTFRDIAYLCEQNEKIAVNPFGFNMVIDKNALAMIQKVSADIALEEDIYEEEPVTLFELRSVPNDMIYVLQNIMNQTNGIQAAYLKGITRGDISGYLVIVDLDNTDSAILTMMEQQVSPYTQGVPIEFVTTQSDLGREAAQSTYPFYQR